jgi:hypothetical protein
LPRHHDGRTGKAGGSQRHNQQCEVQDNGQRGAGSGWKNTGTAESACGWAARVMSTDKSLLNRPPFRRSESSRHARRGDYGRLAQRDCSACDGRQGRSTSRACCVRRVGVEVEQPLSRSQQLKDPPLRHPEKACSGDARHHPAGCWLGKLQLAAVTWACKRVVWPCDGPPTGLHQRNGKSPAAHCPRPANAAISGRIYL